MLISYNTFVEQYLSFKGQHIFNYPEFFRFYDFLFYTGCRPVEVNNPYSYTLNIDNVIFQPAKGNNTRILLYEFFDAQFLYDITNRNEIFSNARYNTTLRFFVANFPIHNLSLPDKSIQLYCFRHFFIKNLYSLGFSDEQIKIITGEIETKNLQGYRDSQITGYIP